MRIEGLGMWKAGGAPGRGNRAGGQTGKLVDRAMTDGFIRRMESLAKRDAQRGVYMSREAVSVRHEQMRQWVSPDRARPVSQVTVLLREAAKEHAPLLELLDKLAGGCSGKIQSDPLGQTAEIRAPNGEVIASYNSPGGGWTEIQTKAERKFLSEAAAVYAQAFREARAERNAAQNSVPSGGAAVDLLA